MPDERVKVGGCPVCGDDHDAVEVVPTGERAPMGGLVHAFTCPTLQRRALIVR